MDADQSLAALAAGQSGLITRGQALNRFSVSAFYRRVAAGHWVTVHPGVFRAASTPTSWQQSMRAATMAVPHSLAYGLSAARLLGLPVETASVHLAVEAHQKPLKGVVLHKTGVVSWIDQACHQGIPTTSVTRTLLDVSRILPPEAAAEVLDAALARQLTPLPYLVRRFEKLGSKGRKGAGVMGELLAERAAQTRFADSRPQRVLWQLIQERGWPGWVQEFRIVLQDGREIFIDAACPSVGFGVEVNSFRWHSQMSQWASDHERNAAAIAEGWDLLPVTPYRLYNEPEKVGDLIELGLQRRGYAPAAGLGSEKEGKGGGGRCGECELTGRPYGHGAARGTGATR